MTEETGQAILAELRKLTASQEREIPSRPMSPAEFGKIIGKHPKTVKRWIGRGKLRAKVEGHTILISPVEARKFIGDGLEAAR